MMIVVNLSPIVLAVALSILARKFGSEGFHPKPYGLYLVPNQFVVLLRQSNKTPQYRTWYRKLMSFLKLLLSRFLQLLVWLLKTWRYRLHYRFDYFQ